MLEDKEERGKVSVFYLLLFECTLHLHHFANLKSQ